LLIQFTKLKPQQQLFPCYIGGQGTVPYEQYKQQSPCFGRSTLLQLVHS